VEAGSSASLESSLGLGGASGGGTGAPLSLEAGFALSKAGGVAAAVESVRIARADSAAGRTVQAFGVTGVSPSARVGPADKVMQPRAYAPPRADPRAVSFGFGVPLRPRVTGAAELRAGAVALRPYEDARALPFTRDPTVPPWIRRPAPAATTAPSARHSGSRKAGRTGCGCGCGPTGARP
jgi:hypothetical protein